MLDDTVDRESVSVDIDRLNLEALVLAKASEDLEFRRDRSVPTSPYHTKSSEQVRQRPRKSITANEEINNETLRTNVNTSEVSTLEKSDGKDGKDLMNHKPKLFSENFVPPHKPKTSVFKRLYRHAATSIWASVCVVSAVVGGILKKSAPDSQLWNLPLWLVFVQISVSLSVSFIYTLILRYSVLALQARFATTQRVLYYLMGTRTCIAKCLSGWTILGLFFLLFAHRHTHNSMASKHAYSIIYKLLICLGLFLTVDLLSTLLTKALSTKYHNDAHFDKMNAAIRNEYYLNLMSRPRKTTQKKKSMTEGVERRARRGSMLLMDVNDSIENLTVDNTQDAEANLPPDVQVRLYQMEKYIRTNNASVLSQMRQSGNTLDDAVSMAHWIYWNICGDKTHCSREDLEDVVGSKHVTDAFAVLDADKDGELTIEELKRAVISIYEQRANLSATLRDSDSIIGRLNAILASVIHVVFFFFYLMIFNANVTRVWLTFSSMILVFSFIFSVSIRSIYESILFLFYVHSYDIGDVIQIDISGVDTYSVVKMSIMTTLLKRADNLQIWYPNVKLTTLPIINLSRSTSKMDSLKIGVDIGTPASTFEAIRHVMQDHVDTHPKDFTSRCTCGIFSSQDPLKVVMQCKFTYNFSPSDSSRVGQVRHALFQKISEKLADIEANYSAPKSTEPDGATTMQQATANVVSTMLKPELLK